MADLRIVDAPLLSTVKGTEKIPTGGEGNFSVSVNQVADFAKLKWVLATEGYVDNAVGNVQADLNLHKNSVSNPHQVTKAQVGLGNVDNTADADKPLSDAEIAALSLKADKAYVDTQDGLKADKSELIALKIISGGNQNQQDINDFGGARWYAKYAGYDLGATVKLANGDIVRSIIANNIINPNTDMTGWEFNNSKIFKSYSEMAAYSGKNGQLAETISYYAGLGYGGATYVYNGSNWVIQPKNATISIEQFGARCGEKPAATFNVYPVETTDNTNAVKSAFTYALNNGLKLIAENNKCFFFESIDSLQFYGDVECDFNQALFFYSVALATDKKLYKFLQVSGMRKKLANLEITSNGYMGYGVDFNKSLSDNQALTVEKLRVYNCRWGASVLEPECINRIRFVNCDFTSNYYAGIYFKSFDTTWGHSAPVFFRDTIVNGNGPQSWILNSDAKYNIRTGGTISVRDTTTDVGQQAYFKGFSGLHWLGGQISCHGGGRNSSLATFKNCNMVTLDAFDLEDIDCFSLDGTALTTGNYTTYTNEASGAAIVADACVSISVRSPNLFGINAPAVLKLMNNPASYDYQVATPLSGFAFTVWDISSPVNGFGVNNIHPYALVYGESVSPIAFANAATKESVSSVIHHEQGSSDYTVNWPSLKTLWQNGNLQATVTDGYLLKYLSNHDQALVSGTSGHLYNEFIFPTQPNGTTPSDYAKWIFLEFTHGQPSDGRLVVQCLDAANAILASSWSGPSENATHYPVSGWFRLNIPTGTKKIRYGFVNSANYNGAIRQHFWGSGTPRCNDWHFSVYIVHDGNGAMRNKARTNYSACVDEYRNRLIHQANTVAANTVNLAGAATLADVIAAVNTLAASDNAVKTTLKNAGVIKTT